MSKKKLKPWEERGWVCGNVLSSGNQGRVYLARKADESPDQFRYAIKLLTRNNMQRSRTVFAAEATMLQILSHPGIPTVIDTNANDFRGGADLYLVMPYINGTDLNAHVQIGISFDDAISVVIAVLKILDYCHSLGRLHRDIKPCHVLIVDNEFRQPYLIDFGIGFADDDIAQTGTGEGKGNRFVVGPEHTPSGTTDNRNSATDVCQCLGLLYYILTGGREPGVLLDSEKRKPHQREPIRYGADIPEWKRIALTATFDRGFEWHPLNRWRSARELADRLTAIASPEDTVMLRIQAMAASVMTDGLVEARLSCAQIAQELKARVEQLIERVVDGLQSAWNGRLDIQLSGKRSCPQGVISFRPAYMKFSPVAVLCESKTEPTQLRVRLLLYNGNPDVFGSGHELDLCVIPYDSPEAIEHLEITLAECLIRIAKDVVTNTEIA